ncbi:odorant receptor 10a [Amyelois transitella]|uniref:odorant receptor 10a n=1 Tax=Amyelois transitella TaxID=680683 RepID=UPI00298FD3B4|nr:odorant receptor 10a [Amyelois transitella]
MVFGRIKENLNILKNNSCETLFLIINYMPTIAGYSFFQNKISVLFWFVHISLALYIYILGTIMYNMYYAKGVADYINSFFSISILLLTLNGDWWSLTKRSSIQDALRLVKKNDDLVRQSGRFADEHAGMMKIIKWIILTCFTFHFVNDVLIFSTVRVITTTEITITSCTGLRPLSGSPNMAICKSMLTFQELTGIIVVATYDAMVILFTSHSTAMYDLLRLDIASIRQLEPSDPDGDLTISKRLRETIYRHTLILDTVSLLQTMYSLPIGVDFANYAVSVMLFFVVPLDICLKFGPLVAHNLLVFFLYCLLGQKLNTAAENVEMAIYDCGWERFSLKHRKLVLFMLIRSQKPVMLYAAKVVPIRLYTFAYTMQMIYKFVAIFKL